MTDTSFNNDVITDVTDIKTVGYNDTKNFGPEGVVINEVYYYS